MFSIIVFFGWKNLIYFQYGWVTFFFCTSIFFFPYMYVSWNSKFWNTLKMLITFDRGLLLDNYFQGYFQSLIIFHVSVPIIVFFNWKIYWLSAWLSCLFCKSIFFRFHMGTGLKILNFETNLKCIYFLVGKPLKPFGIIFGINPSCLLKLLGSFGTIFWTSNIFHIFYLKMHFVDWNFLGYITKFALDWDAFFIRKVSMCIPYWLSILNSQMYFYAVFWKARCFSNLSTYIY